MLNRKCAKYLSLTSEYLFDLFGRILGHIVGDVRLTFQSYRRCQLLTNWLRSLFSFWFYMFWHRQKMVNITLDFTCLLILSSS